MKIKVIREFKDAEHDLVFRTAGEIMEVSEERGKYLVSMKAAELMDPEDGEVETPAETQG